MTQSHQTFHFRFAPVYGSILNDAQFNNSALVARGVDRFSGLLTGFRVPGSWKACLYLTHYVHLMTNRVINRLTVHPE